MPKDWIKSTSRQLSEVIPEFRGRKGAHARKGELFPMNGSTIHTRVSLSNNHASVKARSARRYFGVPPANELSDDLTLSHPAAEIYLQEDMRARWDVRPNASTNTMMMQSGTEGRIPRFPDTAKRVIASNPRLQINVAEQLASKIVTIVYSSSPNRFRANESCSPRHLAFHNAYSAN